MKKKIISIALAVTMILAIVPSAALAREPAPVWPSAEPVREEVNRWNTVPSWERDTPTDMRVPFRVMWLIYPNGTWGGGPAMTPGVRQAVMDEMAAFKTTVERATQNNVEIINEYLVVERAVEFSGGIRELLVGANPERGQLSEADYNFIFIVTSINPALIGTAGTKIDGGWGFAGLYMRENMGNPGGLAVHEFLHTWEFGWDHIPLEPSDRHHPIPGINMPNTHAWEAPHLGYEGYYHGLMGDWIARSHREYGLPTNTPVEIAISEQFLRGDVMRIDPETGEVTYTGIFPSMWRWIVDRHAWWAAPPFVPFPSGYRVEGEHFPSNHRDLGHPNFVRQLDAASGWARDGIIEACIKGFVPPILSNSFTSPITREEFAQLAVIWVQYYERKTIETILTERGITEPIWERNPFTDTNNVFTVNAYALNIVNGIGGGLFNPSGQITREQAATMIRNVARAVGMDVDNFPAATFADIGDVSDWARDAVAFVQHHGIMSGVGGNRFDPKGTYTREQSIVTFNRLPS
jgi:hypothetical protein